MTTKEKAIELVNKYISLTDGWVYGIASWEHKKKCALIAVDEILKAPFENSYIDLVPDEAEDTTWFWDKFTEFWQEVKQEIQKL
jgi:hypothetical protein